MSESLFDRLSKINVNDKTESKGGFTYLSWAFAWSELKKAAPNAEVKVYHDELTNKPYFGLGDAGVLVKVGVIVDGLEHISYLPCMDFKNKSIPESKVDAMHINKAIQRATVKAIGLHGLGLYIYAGEDLPEDDAESKVKKSSSKKEEPKKDPKNNFRKTKAKKIQEKINNEEPEL